MLKLLALAWPWVEMTGLSLKEWGLGLGTCGLVNIPGQNKQRGMEFFQTEVKLPARSLHKHSEVISYRCL